MYVKVMLSLFLALALGLFLGFPTARLYAQDPGHGVEGHSAEEVGGHSHGKLEGHGGSVTMTREFHFEVVFHRDKIQVYLYGGEENPLSTEGVSGSVRVRFRDRNRKRVEAALVYVNPNKEAGGHEHGQGDPKEKVQDYLEAKVDLSKVPERGAKATIRLEKVPGQKEREVSFTETFRLARLVEEEHEEHGPGGHDR